MPSSAPSRTARDAQGVVVGANRLLADLRTELAANPGRIADTALGVLAAASGPGAEQATTAERAPGIKRPPGTNGARQDVVIVAPDLLNENQERVIRSAMNHRLTVAQGPPGTGKSQLVSALVATATAAGETVLVGSTNNRAVDEVTDRCTEIVGPGLIIRSGNKEHLAQEPRLVGELLAAQIAARVRAGRLVLQRRCDDMSSRSPNSWRGYPGLLKPLPGCAPGGSVAPGTGRGRPGRRRGRLRHSPPVPGRGTRHHGHLPGRRGLHALNTTVQIRSVGAFCTDRPVSFIEITSPRISPDPNP